VPKLIQKAIIANVLGLLCTCPCLIKTTPLNMVAFFCLGIPLFAAGFVMYLVVVVRDLRSHDVF
jgi:hypothetical protein